jgi:hypothetical protein
MPAEVLTIVKIPLSEIAESVRQKHMLPSKLTGAIIEGENLVLSFSEEEQTTLEKEESPLILPVVQNPHRKRRPRKKRNRMKTRGWSVVARITNSKGQKCSIYKPFVDALQNPQLAAEEQRRKVESILKANRNKPSEQSINYFLENTLEYLQSVRNKDNGGTIT